MGDRGAGKTFTIALLAPGRGQAGRTRRGRIAYMVWLALLGLSVAMAAVPPVNLPVLILMALPPLALVLWWLVAAAAVALEAGRDEPPLSPLPLAAEAAANVFVFWGAVLLAYALSPMGAVTTPDDHMAPTTLEGDLLVTWKDYYADRLPERGDVAVVQLPGVEGDRIMRIIGLPGDSLVSILGVLNINGEAVGRESGGDFSWRDAGGTHRNAPRYVETLPGGAAYGILQSAEGMFKGALFGASLRIPDGHYFVIGDNRDSSKSSWDFGMLPGLVIGDRPTVILSSSRGSLIGSSVQP